jgi:hypothetical protein
MNEVIIEDEILPEPKEMGSLQIEGKRSLEMNENNFKMLHS